MECAYTAMGQPIHRKTAAMTHPVDHLICSPLGMPPIPPPLSGFVVQKLFFCLCNNFLPAAGSGQEQARDSRSQVRLACTSALVQFLSRFWAACSLFCHVRFVCRSDYLCLSQRAAQQQFFLLESLIRFRVARNTCAMHCSADIHLISPFSSTVLKRLKNVALDASLIRSA